MTTLPLLGVNVRRRNVRSKLFINTYFGIERIKGRGQSECGLRIDQRVYDHCLPPAGRTDNHGRMSRHHRFVHLSDFVHLKFKT